ncbi:hypothetical protein [Natronosalvus caseinilyticus]|uniref:hypothetical protein n=1 Tax=Natronosalvus caseinilyticus TaxID=2953747 RepID=UPI0028B07ECC|nr:hypothetical protein [Natronosalvus caseinilyticus]
MVDINGVAIYRCVKQDDLLDQLAILDSEDIRTEDNETVREVTQNLIENLIEDPTIGERSKTPEYGNSKSARIHEYTEEVDVERSNGFVTRTVLEELRHSANFDANSEALAEWYLEESQSRSDLLLIISYTYDGENFAGIIKTPYLDDAYQTDPSEILREARSVIQENTHKGIIHPRYDLSVEQLHLDEAKVYQRAAGSDPASYWTNFVRLADSKTEDEELVQDISEGRSPIASVQSTSEFSDLTSRVEGDIAMDGRISIEIGGDSLSVDVEDLVERNVRLAKKDGTYFVIFVGGRIDVEASDGNRNQELPELDEYEDLENALSEYL